MATIRYRVDPDNIDIDPRVVEIIEETEARNGTVQEAYDALVAEGFESEASYWVVKLFDAVGGFMGNA